MSFRVGHRRSMYGAPALGEDEQPLPAGAGVMQRNAAGNWSLTLSFDISLADALTLAEALLEEVLGRRAGALEAPFLALPR